MKEPSGKPIKSMTADERRQSGMEFVKEMVNDLTTTKGYPFTMENLEHAMCQCVPRSSWSPFEGIRLVNGELQILPVLHPGYLKIDRVIFNDPATVVYWQDGSKTVVKCQPGDTFSKETGLALAFMKRALGNKGNFNDIFRKWVHDDEEH